MPGPRHGGLAAQLQPHWADINGSRPGQESNLVSPIMFHEHSARNRGSSVLALVERSRMKVRPLWSGTGGVPSVAVNREDAPESVDALLAEQKTFYDLRAPDFGDATRPDRVGRSTLEQGVLRSVIDEFDPGGDVLELACGTGWLTRELARHTDSLTAVDASLGMIRRARNEVDTDGVRFVQADIFDWTPDRAYDGVFFANWLSHVPPSRFDDFWSLVARCVRPQGPVGFIDEDDRAIGNDHRLQVADTPTARRTLRDGRTYHVVKVFWHPDQLQARLEALGWTAHVRRLGNTFLYGVARLVNN